MDILPAFPQHPDHRFTVKLAGVLFRLRFVYRPRLRAWYFDLFAADETPLVHGRRVSAGWAPLLALPVAGAPDGYLWVRGADSYAQADLGDSVRLVFYARDEIPTAADDGDPIVELGA